MPRYARMLNEKQIYHVMLRGNNREKIFIDEDDKARIIDTISEKKKEGAFFLYAYCVMDNHIHLVIKEGSDPLARIIKRVGASYAYYFNKKYKRIGHVFQDRYRSENVHDDKYLLALIRYVHQNPVKAGLGEMNKYKWSSYREYIKHDKKELAEVEEVLDIFSMNRKKALEEFIRFSAEANNDSFTDVVEEKESDEQTVEELITNYLCERNLQISQLKDSCNKQTREKLIHLLKSESSLSLREIAKKLDLGREMVRKIVSKEPSP